MSDPQPSAPTPTPPGQAPAGPTPLRQNVDRAAHQGRRFTPGLFGIILLCFLLPFVSVTCSGQNLMTAKGLDFVIGADVNIDEDFEETFQDLEDFGDTETQPGEEPEGQGRFADDRIDPNIFAIIAFAAAAVGLLLALFLRNRNRMLSAAIAAALIIVSLIAFRIDISGDAEEGEGLISVDYRIGWWGVIIVALVILAAHAVELWGQRRAPPV